MAGLAVVDDARFDAHHAAGPHPERPERLAAARDGLRRAATDAETLAIEAPHASAALLARVHDASYLDSLDRALGAGGAGHLDADTFFSGGSHEAVLRAAGGSVALTEALLDGRARRGLALLRPPGHHAEADRAMGFCMINNVAVAAEAALDAGASRVAIVDWDVHHGNGTQHVFEGRSDVLFVSLHQYPLYPGTGAPEEVGHGAGRGATLNLALPPGSGDAVYGEAFRRVVIPALEAHRPDVLLVSAGFDAHARDPLAAMELHEDTYGAMATALIDVADALGHGRVGFFLEGGYDLVGLEASVHATARAALGHRQDLPEGPIGAEAEQRIARVLAAAGLRSSGRSDTPSG